MSKFTRYKYGVANERGVVKTIAETYTITEADILRGGQFFKINGAYTITLPVASSVLKGVSIYITGNNSNSKVTVAAGFGGGTATYAFANPGLYNTIEYWCDGTYWYALSSSVTSS